MCGRFTNLGDAIILAYKLGLTSFAAAPRYNIAPTQYAPVALLAGNGTAVFADLHWGLVPSWARDASFGARLINARADSIDAKPSFRDAFKARRCLVPASGFYEWKRDPAAKTKTPHYFTGADETRPVVFAGLWERWRRGDEELRSFTIITTEANALMAPVHDRMPALLAPEVWEEWLDPDNRDAAGLKNLLRQAPEDALRRWEVGPHVNNARNEGEQCIERVGAA